MKKCTVLHFKEKGFSLEAFIRDMRIKEKERYYEFLIKWFFFRGVYLEYEN